MLRDYIDDNYKERMEVERVKNILRDRKYWDKPCLIYELIYEVDIVCSDIAEGNMDKSFDNISSSICYCNVDCKVKCIIGNIIK